MNSIDPIEYDSIGTTIKIYSGQGNLIDLLGTAGILDSTISYTSSLVLSEDMWSSSITGVSELTDMFSIILTVLEGTWTSSTTFESSTSH